MEISQTNRESFLSEDLIVLNLQKRLFPTLQVYLQRLCCRLIRFLTESLRRKNRTLLEKTWYYRQQLIANYVWRIHGSTVEGHTNVKWYGIKTYSWHFGRSSHAIDGKGEKFPFCHTSWWSYDLYRDAHLICYVRFVDGKAMREELHFCKTFSADTTSESIFRMIDTFLKDSDMSWNKCAGICTDGAQAMSGKYTGLRGLIKKVAPEAR